MIRKFFARVLILNVFLVACGNTNNIQILAPGIASGTVKIISFTSSGLIAEKPIKDGLAEFGAAEVGFGLQSLEVQIIEAEYVNVEKVKTKFTKKDYFSASIGSDFSGNQINVNPLTTLATCRLKKTIENQKPGDKQIKTENSLIAEQFKITDLQTVEPASDLSKIEELNASALYAILLAGFDQLAKNQTVSVSELVEMLCSDVGFDSVFNGVGQEGVIQNHGLFDEQVLKAKYAQAIYDVSQQHIVNFAKLPMGALANDISLSFQTPLFSTGIHNYSFDH